MLTIANFLDSCGISKPGKTPQQGIKRRGSRRVRKTSKFRDNQQ